jgi:esterase/lipase superfamily enzyme
MPSYSYVISARAVTGKGAKAKFTNEPGTPNFLRVPEGEVYRPVHAISTTDWINEVRDAADGLADSRVSEDGDVLFFIHGYNNTPDIISTRQRFLTEDLKAEGFHGIVVSFDWPSANSTLNYLEDRSDAAAVAELLVSHGIRLLAAGQSQGCKTNIHLLGHSTGAYLILEAFAQAEKVGKLYKQDWRVDQVGFIGGDIATSSLFASDDWSKPLFSRCVRLTNYQNPFDHVLAVSNAKRLGTSPRAGRVGVSPLLAHPKVANINCGEYFTTLDPRASRFSGTFAHSWYIGNRVWARDFALTLNQGIDRDAIPTRRKGADGILKLQDAPMPKYISDWALEANDMI